jgi:DNA-binding NarL/FixJ family response regulator
MTTDDSSATVLVVDDHQFIATGLVHLLRTRGFNAHAVSATDPAAILAVAGRHSPGVVLLDLDLGVGPDGTPIDGADLVGPLRTAGWTVLVITGTSDLDRIAAAVAAGATNWIIKNVNFDEIARMAIDAAQGRGTLPPAERAALVARHRTNRVSQQSTRTRLGRLSPREREVLDRLADGASPATIAADGYVSIGTVRAHIRSILLKLEVNSQLAAVALARRRQPTTPITMALWRRMLHGDTGHGRSGEPSSG